MRHFDTGATRDSDETKWDYEGFLAPQVLDRFAAYMHEHRKQADGALRASDNWQKGIPREVYMKSMFRHFMDVWRFHRKIGNPSSGEEALCALLFNVQGMLFEVLKEKAANGGQQGIVITRLLAPNPVPLGGQHTYPDLFDLQNAQHGLNQTYCSCNDPTHAGYVPNRGKVCSKCGNVIKGDVV